MIHSSSKLICRICDGTSFEQVLDLGLQPWANHFLTKDEVGKEPQYPLTLLYCTDCSCVQLDYTVPKEVMFGDHTYVSGTTQTLTHHFAETAKLVKERFFSDVPRPNVLDIGSNDGTQLLQYQRLGFEVTGVESCARVAELAIKQGVHTVIDYFNESSARALGRKFDVINASGVFFHLEELHSAARGIQQNLAENGVFVIQFLYMRSIVENLAFDQIYHEHLLYYTLATVEKLLSRHGLESFDGFLSPIHGGSMILFVTHKGRRPKSPALNELLQAEVQAGTNSLASYRAFARRVQEMKADTLAYLVNQKAAGKRIYGMGAPVKGNTFLNFCGIGTQYLDCLVEKNPLRKGLYSPGMHLPIVLEGELLAPPDIYLVLAWNFKKEILRNNAALIAKGVEFYFPVNPKE